MRLWVSKFAHFVEYKVSCQSTKSQWCRLSRSNFTMGMGNTPPPTELPKNPVLLRLMATLPAAYLFSGPYSSFSISCLKTRFWGIMVEF